MKGWDGSETEREACGTHASTYSGAAVANPLLGRCAQCQIGTLSDPVQLRAPARQRRSLSFFFLFCRVAFSAFFLYLPVAHHKKCSSCLLPSTCFVSVNSGPQRAHSIVRKVQKVGPCLVAPCLVTFIREHTCTRPSRTCMQEVRTT